MRIFYDLFPTRRRLCKVIMQKLWHKPQMHPWLSRWIGVATTITTIIIITIHIIHPRPRNITRRRQRIIIRRRHHRRPFTITTITTAVRSLCCRGSAYRLTNLHPPPPGLWRGRHRGYGDMCHRTQCWLMRSTLCHGPMFRGWRGCVWIAFPARPLLPRPLVPN